VITNEIGLPVHVLGHRFQVNRGAGGWVELNRPATGTFTMPLLQIGEGGHLKVDPQQVSGSW
jgi:hypothetical protein